MSYGRSIFFEEMRKKRKVIFLDIDGVLQPCSNQYRFDHDMYQTRQDMAEKFQDDRYLELDRYDVAAVCYDWDEKAVGYLKDLIFHSKAEIVISSDWKRTRDIEDMRLLFKIHRLDGYITDMTPFEQFSSKADDIREYLKSHPDIGSYVVIDDLDMEKYFRGHTVYTGRRSRLDKEALLKAERILEFGPWWSDLYRYETEAGERDLIEDHYKKVIFLDIDGVLNDEGDEREKGVVIDPYFVRNLFQIVDKTGAEIILSSSWRYSYGAYAREGFPGDNKDLEDLLQALDKYGLKVPGITPLLFNGPDGRPFEIRSWLCHRPEVENFVILDDDTFWNWQWLGPHFLCTTRKNADGTYKKGLDRKCAYEAIQILKPDESGI